MPLPLPNLDDRRWTDLVEEGRALIPRHAPEWTDHNIHDPGITLLELFAWLTEMTVYRLNRVPERHRRKLLSLVGFDPLPPRPAHTILTFDPEPGTAPFTLPEGAEFEATDADGQLVRFRTLRELTVAPVEMKAVQVEEVDASGVASLSDRTQDWHDGLPILALGQHPKPGAALYLGFNVLPSEIPIALALRFQGPGNDTDERRRLLRESAAQRVACRPVLPDIPCEENSAQPEQVSDILPPHHSASLVWEAHTGTALDPWILLQPVTKSERPVVGQVMDDTRALTFGGIVELNLPATLVKTALGTVAEPLFYLRGRLAAGGHDAPPSVTDIAPNGVAGEQAVPVVQTFSIAAGVAPVGPTPTPGTGTRLSLRLDGAGIIQSLEFAPPGGSGPEVLVLRYEPPSAATPGQITLELIRVAVGDRQPNQRVTLPQAPVQFESLALYTHRDNTWQEWTRREDFDASHRSDFHFVLDATRGEISFGDGERGRAPEAGDLILAVYRATRAGEGNVGAGKVTRLAESPRNARWLAELPPDVGSQVQEQLSRKTTNRMPASGGAAVESLASATGRAVETLHAHERLLEVCAEAQCQTLDQIEPHRVRMLQPPTRAINLLDIERLALAVPGTRIARTRAWSSVHPSYPCLRAPGVVSVVVVPDQPVARPGPTAGLLEAVRRYLDRRRMVTTRVEVVGPQYLEVRVQARIRMRLHTDRARVRERIREALDAFLDPRTGGPAGMGWPFGRDVYRSEILQLIDSVPGVDHVLALSLSAGSGEPQCGDLPLCPTSLVTPGMHRIEIA